MLMRFAFYNLRPGVDPADFAAFETRIARDYTAACLTMGLHSLGTYRVISATGHWTFRFADIYVVEGDSPALATARIEAATSPPGYDEIIEECRGFMNGQDDRASFWLMPRRRTYIHAIPLGTRVVELRLLAATQIEGVEDRSAESLGDFEVPDLDGFKTAEVNVLETGSLSKTSPGAVTIQLKPVVVGADFVPVV